MLKVSRSIVLALAVAGSATVLGANSQSAHAQTINYRLVIHNKCNRTIYVARRMRSLSGQWTTRGWIVVRAGRKQSRTIRTSSRVFYLYAVSADRKLSWHGYRKQGSVRRPVVMRRFTHRSGPIDAAEVIMVHFARKRIRSGRTILTQGYLCTKYTGGAGGGGGGAGGESEGGGRDPGSGGGGGNPSGGGLPELGPNPGGSGAGGQRGEGGGGGTGRSTAGGGGAGGSGAGSGTQVAGNPAALAALRGRKIWVSVKSRTPSRDYCATLRRAGMVVECDYGYNVPASLFNTIIVECPTFRNDAATTVLKLTGLTGRVRVYDWRKPSNAGKCKNFFGIKLRMSN